MNNYLIHMLSRLKTRGITPKGFIDVGAHFGETVDTIRQVYGDANILSIEANPACEEVIRSKRVNYAICLLGQKSGAVAKFFVNRNDPTSTGCSVYLEKTDHFKDANILELDTYALDDIITNKDEFDFLKMDVQGAEIDVMKGATKLLEKIRWVYAEVSFTSFNEGAPLFNDVNDYLRQSGFAISDMCDPTYVDHKLIQCNILFERKQT
jgi:FkbM family methyltransferase